jgi:hypothetical protein
MYNSTLSLTLAPDGGERSASRYCRFTPKERAPGTYWIGDWMGPRAILDAVVKRKIPSPCRESKPRILIVQPVAQCYTNWAIMALINIIKQSYIYIYVWTKKDKQNRQQLTDKFVKTAYVSSLTQNGISARRGRCIPIKYPFFRCVLCYFAYLIGLDHHLLHIQIYGCNANYTMHTLQWMKNGFSFVLC